MLRDPTIEHTNFGLEEQGNLAAVMKPRSSFENLGQFHASKIVLQSVQTTRCDKLMRNMLNNVGHVLCMLQ